MATITISYNGQTFVYESEENGKNTLIHRGKIEPFDKKNKIVTVGNSKIYIPNYNEDYIQSAIFNTRIYFEQSFLDELSAYLPKKPTIIDIGANIGNHTLYWANENNAKKIYAFEPIPSTFKILKKNVKINNLQERVKLYNIGLSEETAKGHIVFFDSKNIGATRLEVSDNEAKNTIPLTALDSIKFDDKKIDLIKIDVECMDYLVLTGAIKTIQKYKPIIMIESFSGEFNISSRILKALNYRIEKEFNSSEYLFVPINKK